MPQTRSFRSRRKLPPIVRPLTLTVALALAACSSNGSDWGGSRMSGATPASLSPDQTADTLIKVGDETRASGDFAAAISLYRRAYEVSQRVAPLQRLGETLAQMQAYTEASQAYETALGIEPENPDLHRGLGNVLLALGQPQLAMSHLEIAARKRPDDPRVYNALGVANDLSGRHDLAQQDYRKGLSLAPDQASLRNNLGLSQALAGDYKGAIATLSDLAARPGASPRNRQNLALVYGLAGDNDHAAAVARADLDEAAINNNIHYFTLLRSLDDVGRTAAILGADVRSARAAQPAATVPDRTISAAPAPAPIMPVTSQALTRPDSGASPVAIKPAPAATPQAVVTPAPLRPEHTVAALPASASPSVATARPPAAKPQPTAAPTEPSGTATAVALTSPAPATPTVTTSESRSAEKPRAEAAPAPVSKRIIVQIASFQTEAMARKVSDGLAAKGVSGLVVVHDRDRQGGDLYAIRTGDFPTEEAAQAAAQNLRATGAFGSMVVHVSSPAGAPEVAISHD